MDWNDYHKLEDIDGYLSYLASKYPETVQLISIGQSYENRSLNLVRISSNLSSKSNPAIWIDGGQFHYLLQFIYSFKNTFYEKEFTRESGYLPPSSRISSTN